jgi:hypothetical protein
MRRVLLLVPVLLFAVLGCETASLGGRCETDNDCERVRSSNSPVCLAVRTGAQCRGQGALDCICCPMDPAMRALYGDAGCVPSAQTTDAATDGDVAVSEGGSDAPDASDASDIGPTTCSMDCGPDGYCNNGVCRTRLPIGQACTNGTQCSTTFCVGSVCCNSACTCAGCSCNSTPDFAGVCMPMMSVPPRDASAD